MQQLRNYAVDGKVELEVIEKKLKELYDKILERNQIDKELIKEVGLIETGEFQFKVANEIRDKQVIIALALIKYLGNIE